MSNVYVHKKSGRKYILIKEMYKTLHIKQESGNYWEEAFFYMNIETLQPFVTGKKRWEESFEMEKEND